MKTTLYLIRHGQTMWNKEKRMQGLKNSDLTKEGVIQATLLGEKLVNNYSNIDLIVTSPSIRACETTSLINCHLKVPVIRDEQLQEIDMGSWEGLTYEEISLLSPMEWQCFWSDSTAFKAFNGGETFSDLTKRSAQAVAKILDEHRGRTVAIVSHRITIKAIVSHLLNIPIDSVEDVLPNSLTKLEIEDGKINLESFSDISHYD